MIGESPRVFTETRPRARKEHTCCECARTIPVGDIYVRASGRWDDSGWCTFKTCVWCDVIRRSVVYDFNGPYEEEPAFGCLYEWIEEYR